MSLEMILNRIYPSFILHSSEKTVELPLKMGGKRVELTFEMGTKRLELMLGMGGKSLKWVEFG